jgi:hypothetical protein
MDHCMLIMGIDSESMHVQSEIRFTVIELSAENLPDR